MSYLKACRICLALRVKIVKIENTLEVCLKSILGCQLLYSSAVPQYACLECACLLEKFNRFKEKCLLSQTILFNILQDNNEILEKDLESVDRQKLKLLSGLTHYQIPQSGTIIIDNQEEDNLAISVKEEILDDTICVEYNTPFEDEPCSEDVNGDNRLLNEIFDEDDEPLIKFHDDFAHLTTKLLTKSHKKKKKKSKKKQAGSGLSAEELSLQEDFIVIKQSEEEIIQAVQNRRETSNYKEFPFKCDICYKGFLRKDTMNNHMLIHSTSVGDFVCSVCGARFENPRRYTQHRIKHGTRYQCRACPFTTNYVSQAKRHKQWHQGVTYKCHFCGEVFKQLTSLLSHVRRHSSGHVCARCGHTYVSERGLRAHCVRAHPDDEEEKQSSPRHCADCSLDFRTEQAYERHLITSTEHKSRNELKWGCGECGTMLPTSAALRSHRRQHAAPRSSTRITRSHKSHGNKSAAAET